MAFDERQNKRANGTERAAQRGGGGHSWAPRSDRLGQPSPGRSMLPVGGRGAGGASRGGPALLAPARASLCLGCALTPRLPGAHLLLQSLTAVLDLPFTPWAPLVPPLCPVGGDVMGV